MAKIGNQGDGGGRPPFVFTQDQIAQIEQLAAILSKKQISDFFGISDTTFRECEGRQPEVFDAYRQGKAKAIANIGKSLVKKALDGDGRSQEFYLKCQAGWRTEDNLQDIQNSPVTINIVKPDGAD
jgi:hypothetical protein